MNIEKYKGLVIKDVVFGNNLLVLTFDNNKSIEIHDAGQNCCEKRYMHTDDDVNYIKGAKLLDIEEKPSNFFDDSSGDIKECVFLEVKTDKGLISFANYNEHNGYYGGFDLVVEEVK